jgi:hypothetical protein
MSAASRTRDAITADHGPRNRCSEPPATPGRWLDPEPPTIDHVVLIGIDIYATICAAGGRAPPRREPPPQDLVGTTKLADLLLEIRLRRRDAGMRALIELSLLGPTS